MKITNITEYIKSLQYEYRLNEMKATAMQMKHNVHQLKKVKCVYDNRF